MGGGFFFCFVLLVFLFNFHSKVGGFVLMGQGEKESAYYFAQYESISVP